MRPPWADAPLAEPWLHTQGSVRSLEAHRPDKWTACRAYNIPHMQQTTRLRDAQCRRPGGPRDSFAVGHRRTASGCTNGNVFMPERAVTGAVGGSRCTWILPPSGRGARGDNSGGNARA